MSQKPELKKTSNYGQFVHNQFNRNVDPAKVQRLVESMKIYGYLAHYPMHCIRREDGKLEIKAGHHRFTAAQHLGIPVWYIVAEDGGVSIHELERSSSAWSLRDFVDSYERLGIPSCQELNEYVHQTGIPIGKAASMLLGQLASSNNALPVLKSGNFRIAERGRLHAGVVASLSLCCKESGFEWSTTAQFIEALSRIAMTPEIDIAELKRRIAKYPFLLSRGRRTSDYVAMFESLYNHFSKSRVPLVHLADETARQRNAAKPNASSFMAQTTASHRTAKGITT